MELLELETTIFFEKKIFGKNFLIFGGAGVLKWIVLGGVLVVLRITALCSI